MLFLGRIAPNYANAVTRLFNAALRNLDHADRQGQDHFLDQYLAGLATAHRLSGQLKDQPASESVERSAEECQAAIDELLATFLTG